MVVPDGTGHRGYSVICYIALAGLLLATVLFFLFGATGFASEVSITPEMITCGKFASKEEKKKPALDGITIVIDPGHGGQWSGAVASSGLRESELNLKVALFLAEMLESRGARVILTRTTEVEVFPGGSLGEDLARRAIIANRAGADFFVSIHHNATFARNVRYPDRVEMYYRAFDEGPSKQIAADVMKNFVETFGTRDVAVVPGGFRVLRLLEMPGILGEGFYISNPLLARCLAREEFQKKEAACYCEAIESYFEYGKLELVFDACVESGRIDKFNGYFDIYCRARQSGLPVKGWLDVDGRHFNFEGKTGKKIRVRTGKLENGYHRLRAGFELMGRRSMAREIEVLVMPRPERLSLEIFPEAMGVNVKGELEPFFLARIRAFDRLGRIVLFPGPVAVKSLAMRVFKEEDRTSARSSETVRRDRWYESFLLYPANNAADTDVLSVRAGGLSVEAPLFLRGSLQNSIFEGFIKEVDGKPVEGASVNLGHRLRDVTGPMGEFCFELTSTAPVCFLVKKLGYRPILKYFIPAPGVTRVFALTFEKIAPELFGRRIGIEFASEKDRAVLEALEKELVRRLEECGVEIISSGRGSKKGLSDFEWKRFVAEFPALNRAKKMKGFNVDEVEKVLVMNYNRASIILCFSLVEKGDGAVYHYYTSEGGKNLAGKIARRLGIKSAEKVDYFLSHTSGVAVEIELPRKVYKKFGAAGISASIFEALRE